MYAFFDTNYLKCSNNFAVDCRCCAKVMLMIWSLGIDFLLWKPDKLIGPAVHLPVTQITVNRTPSNPWSVARGMILPSTDRVNAASVLLFQSEQSLLIDPLWIIVCNSTTHSHHAYYLYESTFLYNSKRTYGRNCLVGRVLRSGQMGQGSRLGWRKTALYANGT